MKTQTNPSAAGTAQHTPGPWKLTGITPHRNPRNAMSPMIVGASNRLVVFLPALKMDNEREANARLIAAAPELLETLKWLITHDTLNDVDMAVDLRAEVEAAHQLISEAEGRA